MNYLLMGQNFPPEPGTAASDLHDLALALLERGHEVTVLTGYPNYPHGTLYAGYRRRPYTSERLPDGIRVVRAWHLMTKNWNSTRGRLGVYLSLACSSLLLAPLLGKFDLIYFSSPPPTLALAALAAKLRSRAPIVMELNDIWPQEAIELGFLSPGPLVDLARMLERFAYTICSSIQVYSGETANYLLGRNIAPHKISRHRMWVDTKVVQPLAPTEIRDCRSQYGTGSRYVVTYAGLLGNAQGIEFLVDAFQILEKSQPGRFALVIAGDGPMYQALKDQSSACSAIELVGLLSSEDALRLQGASDAVILHLVSAGSRLGTIPGKLFYYMALGRPIVACAEGAVADLVNSANCGVVTMPSNSRKIADAVADLYTNRDAEEMGLRGRAYAVEHFDAAKTLAKRVVELERLTGASSNDIT